VANKRQHMRRANAELEAGCVYVVCVSGWHLSNVRVIINIFIIESALLLFWRWFYGCIEFCPGLLCKLIC